MRQQRARGRAGRGGRWRSACSLLAGAHERAARVDAVWAHNGRWTPLDTTTWRRTSTSGCATRAKSLLAPTAVPMATAPRQVLAKMMHEFGDPRVKADGERPTRWVASVVAGAEEGVGHVDGYRQAALRRRRRSPSCPMGASSFARGSTRRSAWPAAREARRWRASQTLVGRFGRGFADGELPRAQLLQQAGLCVCIDGSVVDRRYGQPLPPPPPRRRSTRQPRP